MRSAAKEHTVHAKSRNKRFSNSISLCAFLSFRPMTSVPHAIYFWFSLLFLIARTLAVSLYSSRIHDESKKPANVLRAVPNNSWCIEVRRFVEQVVNDTVALYANIFVIIFPFYQQMCIFFL